MTRGLRLNDKTKTSRRHMAQLNYQENVFDGTYYSQVGFFDQYRYGSPMDCSGALNHRF